LLCHGHACHHTTTFSSKPNKLWCWKEERKDHSFMRVTCHVIYQLAGMPHPIRACILTKAARESWHHIMLEQRKKYQSMHISFHRSKNWKNCISELIYGSSQFKHIQVLIS
jgi:hypothetical protein